MGHRNLLSNVAVVPRWPATAEVRLPVAFSHSVSTAAGGRGTAMLQSADLHCCRSQRCRNIRSDDNRRWSLNPEPLQLPASGIMLS